MQKKLQKIYIIGPAGSGKTTLANKLGKKYNLPILNLDDIFWKTKYTQENSPEQKEALLQKFLNNPSSFHSSTIPKHTQPNNSNNKSKNSQLPKFPNSNYGWVIDGANKDFIPTTSSQATKIIWLNPNIFMLIYRITKRFLISRYLDVRHLSKNKPKTKKETWYGLYWLLKGVISYKLHNDLYRLHEKTSHRLSKEGHPPFRERGDGGFFS